MHRSRSTFQVKQRSGLYPRVRVDTSGSRRSVAGRWGAAGRDDRRPPGWTGRCRRRWRRGASRWRCTTRARCCSIWRSRSRWAGTAWPTSRCCAPSRRVRAGRLRPDGVPHDRRAGRRRRPRCCSRRSTPPGPQPGPGCGSWPASTRPTTASTPRRPLVIDLDATLVTAHSEKEQAAPTFKRGFGHHPLCAFVDHGPDGTGEPLAVLLRKGNAGSNTAADHIAVTRAALAQLPGHRPGAGRAERC